MNDTLGSCTHCSGLLGHKALCEGSLLGNGLEMVGHLIVTLGGGNQNSC